MGWSAAHARPYEPRGRASRSTSASHRRARDQGARNCGRHGGATKGAISNFTAALAQMLGDRGIRVNAVAPGPIWTPLIPSTMPAEKAASFGQQTALSRAGQPQELAPAFVLLSSDEGSYISGAVVPVTGGQPML